MFSCGLIFPYPLCVGGGVLCDVLASLKPTICNGRGYMYDHTATKLLELVGYNVFISFCSYKDQKGQILADVSNPGTLHLS